MNSALSGKPSPANNFILTGRRGNRRVLAWGFLSTMVLGALVILQPSLLQPLDLKVYDRLLRSFPSNQGSSKPVVVDLDEKSLQQYGQWPWPRYQVAELFNKIATLEPSVIGIDMVFAEPDRTSAGRLLQNLGNAYQLDLTDDQLPALLRDNDLILAKTLAHGPFVLGYKFNFNRQEKGSEQCTLHPAKVAFLQEARHLEKPVAIMESSGLLCNLEILSQQVNASGFFNFSPDRDGMLRRLPLLIEYNGEVYPSLALATVLKLHNTNNLLLKINEDGLQTLQFKNITIPIDRHGQVLIKFRGPQGNYDYVSAADIMAGKIPSERLRGQIVFVGTSAAGLKELRTTPFDPIYPGVEVHATVADNLLSGDFIIEPAWSNGLVLLLVLVMGVTMSLLIAFSTAAAGFVVMLLFFIGLWLAAQQFFFNMGVFVGPVFPMASVVGNYIFLTVLKYRLEEKKMLSGLQELLLTQDITIESMANLAEYRDPETGGHIKRTRRYVRLLAEHIKHHPRYRHFLNAANIDMLYKSAPLHDIGKVGIPDHILLKPGRLSEEEFEIMKTHTTIGRDVIESSIRKLGKESFLTIAAEIAHSHQEKWDGSGYPQGLKADTIPVSGRLMALADVYDALISKRVYKPPFPHSMAVRLIRDGRGTHFDPDMVDGFLEIHDQFRNIARKFADYQEELDALEEISPADHAAADSLTAVARE